MLGAYSPSPNVTDGIPLWIENLQRYLLPVITDDRKTRQVIKRWLELNGRPIVDMIQQDFNRKVPSRGLVPRLNVFLSDDESEEFSHYTPASHTITLGWGISGSNRLLKSTSLKNPIEFTSRFVAQSVVGIIVHETVHAMQLYQLSVGYRGREESAWLEQREIRSKEQFMYPLTPSEIPAYSINAALSLSVFAPEKAYQPFNYRDLAVWADKFMQKINFKMLMPIYLIPFLPEDRKNDLRREIYFEQYEPDGNKTPPYAEFLKALNPLEDLAEKNIRRYVRAFQPANVYFGPRNLTTFKSTEV